ncbi:SusC/RagA family TonB-linked outer membrane protein [Sphingobacterium faecale]|uniref:SusC/RagA family TonB-linked outer membrane protein n=1 Tax=Sphingobacterium faecale TaxID=2803775 RepID=A0ABS1R9V5_9SPHI|nr:SusC/RagA family TonB-linked outer membrane protein [Sphingobacterium faecale]MBL1411453.1 SusC/RagA family TonB-linked outer membrane protein [Sphingobacterium faecale]
MRVKLMIFLLVAGIIQVSATSVFSQNITLNKKSISLEEVLQAIKEQTGLLYFYDSPEIRQTIVDIHVKNASLTKVLEIALQNTGYSYKINKNNILIRKRDFNKVNKHIKSPATEAENELQKIQLPEVRGQITDSTGRALVGATVRVVNLKDKHINLFTQTNNVGEFILKDVPEASRLSISYIGYMSLEVPASNNVGVLVLKRMQSTVQEVLINAGYYTVKDREKTGSIAKITAKEIENQPVSNPLEALQGRMAGVYITQNSGTPGGGFDVKIRGQNSIMAGNAPLYIVDGVSLDAESLGSRYTGMILRAGNISPLNAIDPSTIASIEVLKDADATAIYGSRGANGVILITTKNGAADGNTHVNFLMNTGIASISRKLDLLDTEQYLEMRREAYANDGITQYPANAYDVNGAWDTDRYTDWQKVLIGGTARNYRLQGGMNGGNESTHFQLSAAYQNETTVFPGNFNYGRATVQSNTTHTSKNKRFSVTVNLGYNSENNYLPATDPSFKAYNLPPNAPDLYDKSGNLNWENGTWKNPLAEMNEQYRQRSNGLRANGLMSYKLMENLEFKINTGYNTAEQKDNSARPHTWFNPASGRTSADSQITIHETGKRGWLIEPQLRWRKEVGISKFDALFGGSFQDQNNENLVQYGIGFPDNSLINNLSAASQVGVYEHTSSQYRYQSLFGRINYKFREQVIINLTGRRDGSSRFAPGNKFGNFGAIGAAWIFSEQLDYKWLNLGKIRASYGITGNDQIGNYQYLQTYKIENRNRYSGTVGFTPTRLGNNHFKWEANRKFELGLDLSFFEDRLTFSTDYYNNRSSNQLINYSLPGTTGFGSIQRNLDALVQNTGLEFNVSGVAMKKENLYWNISVNLSLPKNKLLSFPGLVGSTYANTYVVGESLTISKRYNYLGVDPETGYFMFRDYNNDNLITSLEDRKVYVDYSNPKFHGGIANSLSYKNWSADVFFQFVNRMLQNAYSGGLIPGGMYNQPAAVMEGRWQNTGDEASFQRFSTGSDSKAYIGASNYSISDQAISDASFLRLKNLAISYKTKFRNQNRYCKFMIQGQNLLTFTSFEGADPEQYYYLPALRKLVFGIELHI